MSQTDQELVCNGAICRCDKGTVPSPLQVGSNQSICLQDKLVATNLDKVFVPFGTCALKNNQPCVPALLVWQDVFELVEVLVPGCHPLLEKSTIKCGLGGTVSIVSTLQVSVPLPPLPPQAEGVRTASLSLCPLLFNPSPSE